MIGSFGGVNRLLSCCGLLMVIGLLFPPDSFGMPNFARQYSAPCSLCHTIIPRLNRVGYEFRRSGFRAPGEIGEERAIEKERITPMFIGANYFDARIQSNVSYAQRNHATSSGAYSPTGGTSRDAKVEFTEFTLYPLTGGFLGHWATMTEISGSTDNIEIENAYLRYVAKLNDFIWEARLGVFHPFEGYGASDRPIGLARPLIQTQGTVNANGVKNGFHPWGFDESGAEAGIAYEGSSLSATIFNGLVENADDPAQGGKLAKTAGSPTQNNFDYQVFFNQFLTDSGAAAAVYYYNGRISLGDPDALHRDSFHRVTGYLSYPVIDEVLLLGGYGWGSDKDTVTHKTAQSKGGFFEVDGYIDPMLGIGARYDHFDPNDRANDNNLQTATAFVNVPLNNGIQFIGEYQYKDTEKVGNPNQVAHSINLRFIYIF